MATFPIQVEVLDDKCKHCPNIDIYVDKTLLYSGYDVYGVTLSARCTRIEACKRLQKLWEVENHGKRT